MSRPLIALVALLIFTTYTSAESEAPSREVIDATQVKMGSFFAKGDYQSWVGFFAEYAIFTNSALTEPVVGREAILDLVKNWPSFETVVEWQVVEGSPVAIGWRERRQLENGSMSGWYRGFSTFVFNEKGEVQEYEGMFNLLSIKAAIEQAD